MRKQPHITDQEINQFKQEQISAITSRLTKPEKTVFFTPKRNIILSLSSVVILVVSVLILPGILREGVEHQRECAINQVLQRGECVDKENVEPTFDLFVQYLNHYITLFDTDEPSLYHPSIKPTRLQHSSVLEEYIYPKSEYEEVYLKQKFDPFQNPAIEDLIGTEHFFQDILDLVNNNEYDMQTYIIIEDESLGEIAVRFDISKDHHVIVETKRDQERWLYKLGVEEEKLSVKAIMFSSEMEDYESALNYNFYYFEYLEDEQSVVINHSSTQIALHYSSYIEKTHFSIQSGIGILEGIQTDEVGSIIRYYDESTQIRSTIELIEDTVISQFHEQMNQHGVVFSYGDYDYNTSDIELTFNLLEATGWDYVYKENMDNWSNDETDNVYNGDTPLFTNERIRTYINDSHALLTVVLHRDQSEITDDLLSLNEYQLQFYDGTINEEYLNNVIVTDGSTIKDQFSYNGISLFTEDVKDQLFEIVDIDCKRALVKPRDSEDQVLYHTYNLDIGDSNQDTLLYRGYYNEIVFQVTEAYEYSYEVYSTDQMLFELYDSNNELLDMSEGEQSMFSYRYLEVGTYTIRLTNTTNFDRASSYQITVYYGDVEQNTTPNTMLSEVISAHYQELSTFKEYGLTYDQTLQIGGGTFTQEVIINRELKVARLTSVMVDIQTDTENTVVSNYFNHDTNWYKLIDANAQYANYIDDYEHTPYLYHSILTYLSDVDEMTELGRYQTTIPFDVIESEYQAISPAGHHYIKNNTVTVDVLLHVSDRLIHQIDVTLTALGRSYTISVSYSHQGTNLLSTLDYSTVTYDDYPMEPIDEFTTTDVIHLRQHGIYDFDSVILHVTEEQMFRFDVETDHPVYIRIMDNTGQIIDSFSVNDTYDDFIQLQEMTYHIHVIHLGENEQFDTTIQFIK